MISYTLYESILEYHDSLRSKAGRWRIKPKSGAIKVDLSEDINLELDNLYEYKGIQFRPKKTKHDSYFTIIQDPSLDVSGNELFAGLVVYSDSLEDLKSQLRNRIEDYIQKRDSGELNESVFSSKLF